MPFLTIGRTPLGAGCGGAGGFAAGAGFAGFWARAGTGVVTRLTKNRSGTATVEAAARRARDIIRKILTAMPSLERTAHQYRR